VILIVNKDRCGKLGLIKTSFVQKKKAKMTYRIIEYFCTSERATFIKVGQDKGLGYHNKIMKEEMAAGMLAESNIGAGASRVLNRYLTGFVGYRIMPSEEKIFRGELAHDELAPEIKQATLEDKTKIRYYAKPLDSLISIGIKHELGDMKEDALKSIS